MGSLWGINFLVIDWGMDGTPPLLFAALRFAVVFFPAVLFVAKPRVTWRVLAAVGALVSLGQFGFLYVAMAAGMPPGLAALVLQGQVVFTLVIAAVALRELPTRLQVVGALLGSAGLGVVAVGRDGSWPSVALAMCLLAALSWAAGNVVTRAAAVPSGLGLTVWSAAVVPLPLLALSFLVDGPAEVSSAVAAQSWRPLAATAYTVVLASLVATGSSTPFSPATRPQPWCRGRCWRRWSRWSVHGLSTEMPPTSLRAPVEPCCSPGCWSRPVRPSVRGRGWASDRETLPLRRSHLQEETVSRSRSRSRAMSMIMSSWPPTRRRLPTSRSSSRVSTPYSREAFSACRRNDE